MTHLSPALVALLLAAATLVACTGTPPDRPDMTQGRLPPCPSSPNCVSTDARDAEHAIAPFELALPPVRAWDAARAAVLELPRTTIVRERPDYLHAECRSALFGFVDDLELQLRPERGVIAVRSASRVGYGDLGVNRRRVESLRERLAEEGVVH